MSLFIFCSGNLGNIALNQKSKVTLDYVVSLFKSIYLFTDHDYVF